jgi:hypothetical protein
MHQDVTSPDVLTELAPNPAIAPAALSWPYSPVIAAPDAIERVLVLVQRPAQVVTLQNDVRMDAGEVLSARVDHYRSHYSEHRLAVALHGWLDAGSGSPRVPGSCW